MLQETYNWVPNRLSRTEQGTPCYCRFAWVDCSHRQEILARRKSYSSVFRESHDLLSYQSWKPAPSKVHSAKVAGGTPCYRGYGVAIISRKEQGLIYLWLTVPECWSHERPPLQPPDRQAFGPELLLKSQFRLPWFIKHKIQWTVII